MNIHVQKCVAAVSVSAAVPVAVPQRKKRKTPVRVPAGGMAVDTPATTPAATLSMDSAWFRRGWNLHWM
jgi:hypothetical protein